MKVLFKQTLIGTTLAYFGVIIGFINALFVRPEYLDLSQIGIFNLVTANAMLLAPIFTAGMTGSVIKFFPHFEKRGLARDQFFSYLLTIVLVTNASLLLLGFVFQDVLEGLFVENSGGYLQYLSVTAIIIVSNSSFEILYSFCKAFRNIVVPSFLSDIFLRVTSIGLVLGFGFGYWSFQTTVQGLGLSYVVALGVLLIYVKIKHGIRLSLSFGSIEKEYKWKIMKFGGYSLLLAGSYAFIENVSYVQVSSLIGDEANGIFSTCFMVGILMEIPRRNMLKVLAPMFSQAMEDQNLPEVKSLYEKGSITITILGGLIFIAILTNLSELFSIIPAGNRFSSGLGVIVWVCMARLMVMVFSFSQEILAFSTHRHWALYFQLLAVLILVVGNYFLLPSMGLIGAGISYFIAMSIHTLLKFIFVYRQFEMSPFSLKHLELLFVALVVFVIALFIPLSFSPMINVLIRTSITAFMYIGIVYHRGISKDINQSIDQIFKRIF